jgi:hypothetical protein
MMLEAAITHEVRHACGLDHVPEETHGRLTMSELGDAGTCEDHEKTLGLGDMLGLDELC